MLVRRLSLLLLSHAVTACALPRPWNQPAVAQTCGASAPSSDSTIFIISFRAIDCALPEGRQFTNYRASSPVYGLSAHSLSNELQIPADAVPVIKEAWEDALTRQVNSTGKAPIVFIHGYNNSQADAVLRARAIKLVAMDSRPVIALTWPSYSKLTPYPWDEANSSWVENPASEALRTLISKYDRVIVIAHSMGIGSCCMLSTTR